MSGAVNLSDLTDDQIVSFEGATYKVTVEQLKRDLENPSSHAHRHKWYVAKTETWDADASCMMETYIESEASVMHSEWQEKAWDCVTQEKLLQIQSILEEMFSGAVVREYWTLESAITINNDLLVDQAELIK